MPSAGTTGLRAHTAEPFLSRHGLHSPAPAPGSRHCPTRFCCLSSPGDHRPKWLGQASPPERPQRGHRERETARSPTHARTHTGGRSKHTAGPTAAISASRAGGVPASLANSAGLLVQRVKETRVPVNVRWWAGLSSEMWQVLLPASMLRSKPLRLSGGKAGKDSCDPSPVLSASTP